MSAVQMHSRNSALKFNKKTKKKDINKSKVKLKNVIFTQLFHPNCIKKSSERYFTNINTSYNNDIVESCKLIKQKLCFLKKVKSSKMQEKRLVSSKKLFTEVERGPNVRCRQFLDPISESKKVMNWLIYPFSINDFFRKSWEKKPLHIKRNMPKYYRSLLSSTVIDKILRENYVLFTKNLDITSFTNDTRETLNPYGRALPSIVWDYFNNGCSVRLLNPQSYVPKLHTLNATLQEFFHCFVGANSYLTPSDSQGFAPHYDDIEAFILQIEGKKRWRLYKPRKDNEFLPRYPSQNFSQKEIGMPIVDTILNAGDLLYIPRGIIHQGDTFGLSEHSLHITLSVYQKNSWGDFLEKLIPSALQNAINNDVRFRRGLPLHCLKKIGVAHTREKNNLFRKKFTDHLHLLLKTLLNQYIDIDEAADEIAKNHIHDFLPPVLNDRENLCSVYEGGERMAEDGIIINQAEIKPSTFIRLSRFHCARLVKEQDSYLLYYSCDNSKEYHEYELQFLEVDFEFVTAIQKIISRFPRYIRVKNLPISDLSKKIQIVQDLWEKGVLITKTPLFDTKSRSK